jgi:fructose-bisphosphate aldolase, class II
MTRATLTQVFGPTHAVPGFVCLGWEDMLAFVAAAEAESAPVILQAGPGCRAHTPLPVLAAMLGHLADQASVPVVIHLDHGRDADECRQAIDLGFTSVMFDGSLLDDAANTDLTAQVASMARAAGVSCEGEIGTVGYAGGAPSTATDPARAARFARDTGVDALAVSVGNVHLQTTTAPLDPAAIAALRAACPTPLVIHGGSGVPPDQRTHLALTGQIAKFNIGTELRQTFGRALRTSLIDPDRFDRLTILRDTIPPLTAAARGILQSLGATGRAP